MPNDVALGELLWQWERALADGRDVPAAELCPDQPELAAELQRRIDAVRQVNQLAGADPRTTSFEQVASVCQDFTGDWNPQDKPALSSYLDRVEPEAQPALLRNLLVIDINRRRAAGEQPLLEDYLQRFPHFATLIRDLFVDISPVSFAPSGGTPNPRITASKVPAVSRLGEYRLLGEVGRGGMGLVYEAVHRQRRDHVALKTLPSVDGTTLHCFKREFRALAGVNHPNLVGLHTLEADGNQWFFTMDLIEGVDFRSYVRPGGVLDEARLRVALAQLVTAVLALHSQHIIHRDLKPSNVLVTRDGHVVVMDFGLALELDGVVPTMHSQERVAGTPAYMAPEQAAGERLTAASDWYAVGVMLYEALSGRRPFSGSLLRLVQDKQHLDPPPLDDAAVPADLAALCLALLARQPQRRPDALALARAVAAGAQPVSAVAVQPGKGLVGREPHLAALREAYRALQRERQPQTVFITGRSGEGKTALAEHFLALLRQDKALAVMSGRCYDRESVPFKALDTLIDALSSYLQSLPGEDAALLVPDDVATLAQVFPVLQRVEVVARAAGSRLVGLDEQQVRQRAFRALRALLTRIGGRVPILWFIDDLQWGDADSAEALFEVLRPPEAPPLLFLGTYRSDETEGSALLKMWKELQRKHDVRFADREVKLAPLTVEECTELVIGLLGKDNEVTRRRAAEFARETRGNPFLLIELVGCFDPDTDSFQPMPLHEVLARKLGRLPAEAGEFLEVVAVAGQALSLEEAAQTARHARPPLSTIFRMRNERLVRLIGPEESPLVDTYHDRVRETVLGNLEEGRSRALHRTLAEVIEKKVGGVSAEQVAALDKGEKGPDEGKALPRAYDLAYHFDAAGQTRQAWVYALLAAEQARRQFSLGVAVEQYAIARRNAEGTTAAVRHRLAVGCGEALMLLGRYDEATAELDVAAGLTDDALAKATVEAYQGEMALKRGWAGRSAALYETALRRLGIWVPQTRLGWGWGLAREGLVHGLHRLFPKWLHREAATSRGDLTSWLFLRLSYTYYHSNMLKSLWGGWAGMNRAERLPPSGALAFSYAGYGGQLGMFGRVSRGLSYLDRSIELRREFNDLWGVANSFLFTGVVLYTQARFEESITKLDEALELYRKSGDQWEVNASWLHSGLCKDKRGDTAAAIAVARTVWEKDIRFGDDNSGHYCLFLWSLAARGDLPFEELKSYFRAVPDNIMASSMLCLGEAYWHWFHERSDKALQACESAYQMVRGNLAIGHLTVATLPYLVTALRRHAEVLEREDQKQAHRLRRRAFRLAKRAARLMRFIPVYYPQALRELSFAYAAKGRLRKALSLAEKSCAIAEGQTAKWEHAESLLLRGRLAQQLGLPGSDEQILTAEAALAARAQRIQAAIRQPAAG
jgi:tetratricopeptide (TPR) repeat protein